MRTVIFLAIARKELIESAKFHEEQRRGLGEEFLGAVHSVLDQITALPASAPVVIGDVRRARVHRFRFDVIYRLRRDQIEVIAVSHQRRHPDHWKNRI